MRKRTGIRTNKFITCLVVMVMLLCTHSVKAEVQPKTKHSVSFKEQTLEEAFMHLQKSTAYKFTYNADAIKSCTERVNASFNNASVSEILKTILKNTPFSFRIIGNESIAIIRKETLPQPPPAEKEKIKVSGKVVDEKGEPLSGVTVRIKGSTIGAATDIDGNFVFETVIKTGILEVTCIGFNQSEKAFNASEPVKFTMKESVSNLDEVTVVAYGQRSKREIVGAISSVKGEQLKEIPAPSIETLLQGRMSGVEVSNISGTPGAGGSRVTIRGYNSLNQDGINKGSPLYVIDGVPVQSGTSNVTGTNMLAGLDPSTIESVEVLKDASSASLYGSRASNGVILITTKKGRAGAAKFGVRASQSYSILPVAPVQIKGKGERLWYLKMGKNLRVGTYDWSTDTPGFPNSYKDVFGLGEGEDGDYDFFWNKGIVDKWDKIPLMAQDSLNPFFNNSTNWWEYAFQTGKITDINLHAMGGSDNFRYMIGSGLYNEKGIMINSDFSRVSFTSNMDLKLRPNVEMFSRVHLSYTNKSGSQRGALQGLTIDPRDISTLLPGGGSAAEKIAMNKLTKLRIKNVMKNVRMSLGVNYNPIRDLKLSSTFSVDYYNGKGDNFTPDFLHAEKRTRAEASLMEMYMLQNENLATYKFNLGNKNKFELMGGTAYTREALNTYKGWAEGGPSNGIYYIGEGWPHVKETSPGVIIPMKDFLSNLEEQVMLSFLGRATYNHDNKYMAEFAIRRDGSSVFGESVRWATFPSLALGWAFSNEKFMKDYWWLSYGKFRASWGLSGQKFDKAYLAHGLMSESSTFLGDLGLIPTAILNNRLTWEKSDQYDLGLDLDFMEYRYSFKLDYYYKRSHSLLMQAPLPGNVYFITRAWNNSSEISNEGIELEFKADIFRKTPLTWTLGFNVSRNWNRFHKSIDGRDLPDKVIGRPIYGLYTFKDEGIVQSKEDIPHYFDVLGNKLPLHFWSKSHPLREGMRKIKDFNYDGIINNDDQYYAGSTLPIAYGGISNELRWKNFDLNALITYTLGRKIINLVSRSSLGMKNLGVIMDDYNKYSFWEKTGDKTDYPLLEAGSNRYTGQFDGNIDSNIENVSYMRLKQLTLGYKLPETLIKKAGMSQLRFYLTMENLFLLTNYSGLDPETVNPYTGKDAGDMYPLARKFTLGMTLNF